VVRGFLRDLVEGRRKTGAVVGVVRVSIIPLSTNGL